MDKTILKQLIDEGKSTREIGGILGKSKSSVSYWIKQYNLGDFLNYKKTPNYKIEKIDTIEKAYMLGFVVADGSVGIDKSVEISIQLQDKEILDYLAIIINGTVRCDYTYNKQQKRFPRARLVKKINDISTFIGGNKKTDRHLPIVNTRFTRYLLLGLFDADGCITWGKRKDKNRLWHKISITSSLKILIGVQNLLLKTLNISTIVRPKSKCDCYIIEFSNRSDVLKFINYIYCDDFVVLNRKYLKAKALRLKLEENGEGVI